MSKTSFKQQEGKLICGEILDGLLSASVGEKEISKDLAALRFVSDCYFTTVTNLVNMIYLPMDMESQRDKTEALLGCYRQLEPLPKPTLDD